MFGTTIARRTEHVATLLGGTFSDESHPSGTQFIIKFPNGWGASVIRNDLSQGGKQGYWEVAALDAHRCERVPTLGDDRVIRDDSVLGPQPVGWLNAEEMFERLRELAWSEALT